MPNKTSPKPSVTFDLTIPQADIQTAYDASLKKLQQSVHIKGFRKGKAPTKMVEAAVDQNKLYESIFETVFPKAYRQALKDQDLHPIAPPKVDLKDAKAGEDWLLTVEIAQKPIVTLGKYQDAIKGEVAKANIWTPGKDMAKNEEKTEDKAIDKAIEILLKTVKVEMSGLLVEDETKRTLSQLLEQINKLGLTVDQYVASLNKKVEDLKKEHADRAEANLKIEYILATIAETEKLAATEADFEKFLDTVSKPETKQQLKHDPQAKAAVLYSLTKRKVLEYLLSLTK